MNTTLSSAVNFATTSSCTGAPPKLPLDKDPSSVRVYFRGLNSYTEVGFHFSGVHLQARLMWQEFSL